MRSVALNLRRRRQRQASITVDGDGVTSGDDRIGPYQVPRHITGYRNRPGIAGAALVDYLNHGVARRAVRHLEVHLSGRYEIQRRRHPVNQYPGGAQLRRQWGRTGVLPYRIGQLASKNGYDVARRNRFLSIVCDVDNSSGRYKGRA